MLVVLRWLFHGCSLSACGSRGKAWYPLRKGCVRSMKNIQGKHFTLKDPGSAITHFIALMLTMAGGIPLLLKAALLQNPLRQFSAMVYLTSMVLLYMASTMYHSFDISETVNRRLKKFDHMMISVLIAGSYTPICLLTLPGNVGIPLVCLIWAMAVGGILLKALWVYCPRWSHRFFILQWDGPVSLRLCHYCMPCRSVGFSGCFWAVLFIPSGV